MITQSTQVIVAVSVDWYDPRWFNNKEICADHLILQSSSSNLKCFGSILSEILHLYKSKYPNFFWGIAPKATTDISPIWDRDGAEISGAGGGGTDSVDKVAVEGWLLLTWLHWWGTTKRKQKLKKKFTTCEFCLTFRGVLGFPTIFGVVWEEGHLDLRSPS